MLATACQGTVNSCTGLPVQRAVFKSASSKGVLLRATICRTECCHLTFQHQIHVFNGNGACICINLHQVVCMIQVITAFVGVQCNIYMDSTSWRNSFSFCYADLRYSLTVRYIPGDCNAVPHDPRRDIICMRFASVKGFFEICFMLLEDGV